MRIFIFMILSCLGFKGLPKSLLCKDFKTGRFSLVKPDKDRSYLIERDGDTQIETDLKTGSESSFHILWLSDCEYELEIIDGDEKIMEFYKDRRLFVRIIETYSNGYKCEAFIRGTNVKVVSILERIPDM